MTAIEARPSFLRASAQDAGNMQMRANGRSRWNSEDRDRAAEVLDRLVRSLYGRPGDNHPDLCFIRFQKAEREERAAQSQGSEAAGPHSSSPSTGL